MVTACWGQAHALTKCDPFPMRFDDRQILSVIHELEQSEAGTLGNGLLLLGRVAGAEPVDPNRDYGPFARELLLARRAGYLTFAEGGGGVALANPEHDPNSWLQQIRDIRLELSGRDRALGREVYRPLPDPDEDDDRPIAGMTLEEIARAIGDVYTGSQIPRFLHDSGVPDEYIPEFKGSKWEYLFAVFVELHDGGSATRRALRRFIGGWLEHQLHTWPDSELEGRVRAHLLQQGWHVGDGRLVVGERETASFTPSDASARLGDLHADIRLAAERYLPDHMEVAIFEAMKAINMRVRDMTGLDLDGSELMAKAFSDSQPRILLADLATETGRNIQTGFRFIFMGAVRGIRNRDAHELFRPLGEAEAFEELAFASMLMRRLDEATIAEGDVG
jgi:uncharacterized protein (TIGR02391 family)